MRFRFSSLAATATVAIVSSLAGCSSPADPADGTGGSSAGGKANTSGGLSSGGSSSGGASKGGASNGGASSGGASSGGKSNGGSSGSPTAGSGGGGSDIPPTFATVKLVFGGGSGIHACASADCHGTGGNAPPGDNLDLTDNDQLYTHLTTHVSKPCNNMKVVVPGKPAESALVSLLKGPCGTTPRMPLGCVEALDNCIPNEYIAAVSQWIANGAPH